MHSLIQATVTPQQMTATLQHSLTVNDGDTRGTDVSSPCITASPLTYLSRPVMRNTRSDAEDHITQLLTL